MKTWHSLGEATCAPQERLPFACPCWGQQHGPCAPYHFPWQLPLSQLRFRWGAAAEPICYFQGGRTTGEGVHRPHPSVPGSPAGAPRAGRSCRQAAGRERENRQHPSLGSQAQHPRVGATPHLARSPPAQVQPCRASRRQGAGGQGPRLCRDGCCLQCCSLGAGRSSWATPPSLYFPFFNYSAQPR